MRPDQVPGFHLVLPRTHLRVRPIAALHRWLIAQDWSSEPPSAVMPKPTAFSDDA